MACSPRPYGSSVAPGLRLGRNRIARLEGNLVSADAPPGVELEGGALARELSRAADLSDEEEGLVDDSWIQMAWVSTSDWEAAF
eukprot:13972099-Alexandrium_andersonii.AAC.1